MRWRMLMPFLLLGCTPATEAAEWEPPRITVEQSGDVTIYTDSLVGTVCYRVGGSLSCVLVVGEVDTTDDGGYDE